MWIKEVLNSTFIPPNLFTTFVENAVKHSVDISGGESYVKIEINRENKQLYFRCVNSRSFGYAVSDKKNSGLGLANITRRLELLYNDTFVPADRVWRQRIYCKFKNYPCDELYYS